MDRAMFDPVSLLVTCLGVFVIAFMKGGFGGGFATVGIPFLALVMDPLTAGALLAPLFVVMDLVALRYWKPATCSKPDLRILLPGLVIGIGLGAVLLNVLNSHAVAIAMALITLGSPPYGLGEVARLRPANVRRLKRSLRASGRASRPWLRILVGRLWRFATGKLALMQRALGLTMCLFGVLLLVSPQPSRP